MPIDDERISHLTDSQQKGRGGKPDKGYTPTAIPAAALAGGEDQFPAISLPLLEAIVSRFKPVPYTPGLTLDVVAYHAGQVSVVEFLIAEYNAQVLAANAASLTNLPAPTTK